MKEPLIQGPVLLDKPFSTYIFDKNFLNYCHLSPNHALVLRSDRHEMPSYL